MRLIVQLKNARLERSSSKAFATLWEVCYNVAYPPSEKMGKSGEGGLTHDVSEEVCRAFLLVVTF